MSMAEVDDTVLVGPVAGLAEPSGVLNALCELQVPECLGLQAPDSQ